MSFWQPNHHYLLLKPPKSNMLPNSPRSNPDSDKPHPALDTLSLGHSRTANVPKDALPRYNRAQTIEELPQTMQWCMRLREQVQLGEMGYLLKMPVSNEMAADYLQVVERPIDLTTIKHKIMLGLYAEAADFNRDMQLLFANALYYTQNQLQLNALLLKVSTNYHRSFKRLSKYSRKKAKSSKHSNPAPSVRNLDKEDEEVYDEAFTRADIELFARCLSELSSRNKSALIRVFCKKHTNVVFHDKTTIALSGLTACQLYDLLQLAKRFKKLDFEVNYPKMRPQQPLPAPARPPSPNAIYSGSESSFEIEDEAD